MSKFYMPQGPKVLTSNHMIDHQKEKLIKDLTKLHIDLSMELKDDDLEGLHEHFNEWVSKKESEYERIELLNPDQLIVRVYQFSKVSPLGILKFKILPIVKVLNSSDPRIQVGDILYAPIGLTILEDNMEWTAWYKHKQEFPGENIPEPPRFRGLLNDWRRDSKFVIDALNPKEEDEFTFIRSSRNFYGKIK